MTNIMKTSMIFPLISLISGILSIISIIRTTLLGGWWIGTFEFACIGIAAGSIALKLKMPQKNFAVIGICLSIIGLAYFLIKWFIYIMK